MRATGVVRRIDELGRIVIPKEIRKTLRVRDGESLEFFLDKDNIVLKKYSLMEDLGEFYKKYIDAINTEINKDIIITDRDKIVATSTNIRKKYINKNISHKLEEMIKERTPIFKNEMTKINIINGNEVNISYSLAPIFVNGDVIGAIMFLSEAEELDKTDNKMCIVASKFLGKYLEQ